MIFELSMLVTQPRITNRAEFEIYWHLHMNSVELQGTQVPSVWTRTKEFSSSELFGKALPGSLAVYPQSGNSQRTCKWSVGGRRPVLTGVYIHVLLADNLDTSISLSKSWWKFLCVLPIRLTPSISHSFLFPSCLPFQGWSHPFPVKFWDLNSWIISLFSLPPLFLTSSSLRIKTPSFFCLGGKRALHWVLFPKSPVTNPNSFLPSPSIFIKDFTCCHSYLLPLMAQFLETWVFSDLYLDTAFLPQITSHQQTCQLQLLRLNSWRFGHYHTRLNMLLPIFCTPSSSYFFWSVLSFLPWNLFCFLPLKEKVENELNSSVLILFSLDILLLRDFIYYFCPSLTKIY